MGESVTEQELQEAVQRLYNLIEMLQRDAEAARVACLALARLSDKPGGVIEMEKLYITNWPPVGGETYHLPRWLCVVLRGVLWLAWRHRRHAYTTVHVYTGALQKSVYSRWETRG